MRREVMRARFRPVWAAAAASVMGLAVAALLTGSVMLVQRLVANDERGSRLEEMLGLEGDTRTGRDPCLPVIEDVQAFARPADWR